MSSPEMNTQAGQRQMPFDEVPFEISDTKEPQLVLRQLEASDGDEFSSRRMKRKRRKARLHAHQISVNEGGGESNAKFAKMDDFQEESYKETDYYFENGLRKVYPYKFSYTCYCKQRWKGKTILKMMEDEFFTADPEYHKKHVKTGEVRVNGKSIREKYVLKGKNELISNTVHRHELPVTAQPIKIVLQTEDLVVIDKPASIPVHPCGRYRHNSVTYILGKEFGFKNLRTIYRLDRLTSGLLIFGRNLAATNHIMDRIKERNVSKSYLCRVEGRFPSERMECKEPLDKLNPKLGVFRVKPGGKESSTSFELMHYDEDADVSVVKCWPHTGRTHQIRVHLQYLGYPIVNDPLYNDTVWGPNKGKHCEYGQTEEQLYEALVAAHARSNYEGQYQIDETSTVPNSSTVPSSSEITASAATEQNSASPENKTRTSSLPLSPLQEKTTPDIDYERLKPEPACEWCEHKYTDPTPDKMVMYLHALSYKGPDWEYSTEEPVWAKPGWKPST